jgi:hypothetical protein
MFTADRIDRTEALPWIRQLAGQGTSRRQVVEAVMDRYGTSQATAYRLASEAALPPLVPPTPPELPPPAEEVVSLLTTRLLLAKEEASRSHYVYLRRWTVGGETWHKVGITSDPDRRSKEQNVIPSPIETLCLVPVATTKLAQAYEQAILQTLKHRRVRGAGNRELLRLTEEEAAAVVEALKLMGA